MPVPTKTEEVTSRFAPYVEELRHLLALRDIHVGSREDLSFLVQRLSTPGTFRNEMSAMIRSIIFREGENITSPELVDLLAVAAAGPEIDPSAQDLRSCVDELREFLFSVRRSLWSTSPDRPWPGDTTSETPEEDDPVPATGTSAQVPAGPERSAIDQPDASETGVGTPARPRSSIFFRAMVMSDGHGPEALDELRAPTAAPEMPSPAAPKLAPIPDGSRHFAWILAACMLLLAVGGGFLLWRQGTAGTGGRRGSTLATEEAPDHSARANPPAEGPVAEQAASPTLQSGSESPDAPSPMAGTALRHNTSGVFFVSSGIMTGNLLSAPAPDYPELANLAHVEGQVVLQAVVSPDGTVSATHALDGHWLLRRSAEQAVRGWRYRPFVVNGRAIDVATIVTMDFRLRH